MPDQKISDLTTGALAAGDLMEFVRPGSPGTNLKLPHTATSAALLNAADAAAGRSALGLANLEAQRRIWGTIPPMPTLSPTSVLGTMAFTAMPGGGYLATSSPVTSASAARLATITSGADFTAVLGLTVRNAWNFAIHFYAMGSGGGVAASTQGTVNFTTVHTLDTSFGSVSKVADDINGTSILPVLMRLRRVSNTIFVEFSHDGHVWNSTYSESISSRMADVTSVGLFFQTFGTGAYIWAFEVT